VVVRPFTTSMQNNLETLPNAKIVAAFQFGESLNAAVCFWVQLRSAVEREERMLCPSEGMYPPRGFQHLLPTKLHS